jgi:hypothetical protein
MSAATLTPERELQALADSLGAEMFEDTPEHRLPKGLVVIWYAEPNVTPVFIFRASLDAATRLKVARNLITRRPVTA